MSTLADLAGDALRAAEPAATSPRAPRAPAFYVGMPFSTEGALAEALSSTGAPQLLSFGAFWRKDGIRSPGRSPWLFASALDSAGFTAHLKGGYRWSVDDYVEWVARNGGHSAAGLPFPWLWWAAPDYCCEPEIAGDHAAALARIAQTVASYGDTLEAAEYWRNEGVNDLPDPLPVLQGWHPADYVECARQLAAAIAARHACTCPTLAEGDESCPAQWHRSAPGLRGICCCAGPWGESVVGVGSVCRRQVEGPAGLVAVVRALCAAPELAGCKFHLFGVKASALTALRPWWDRIASTDSMAWDFDARMAARRRGAKSPSTEERCAALTRWATRQKARVERAKAGKDGAV